MKFSVRDRWYDLAEDHLSIGEARAVKRETGMGVAEWSLSLRAMDPDALAAMVWVATRRAGEPMDWSEIDELDMADLAESIAAEAVAEKPAPK